MGGNIGTPCDLILALDQAECLQSICLLRSLFPSKLSNLNTSLADASRELLISLAIMQAINNGSSIILDQQFLLEKSWAFLGWMKIYHWVLNHREVVSFQRDLSSLNLISYRYAPLLSQNLATLVTGLDAISQTLYLCIQRYYGYSCVIMFHSILLVSMPSRNSLYIMAQLRTYGIKKCCNSTLPLN
ncbi:hypothetical protein THRCLA_03542 [Thraustotheca clavata]|uniref:Uncharacterized protein n=1 Tax=Thraustotheca clavata TaxID=74557 RepID=A0A1W0A2F2_9STRA|nr:hypothetical protein THRCLA_03542 [Thraustotheca clavata]